MSLNKKLLWIIVPLAVLAASFFYFWTGINEDEAQEDEVPALDVAAYDRKLIEIANNPISEQGSELDSADSWIPASAGMTEGEAGMTEGEAGMTEGEAGMTEGEAGMTDPSTNLPARSNASGGINWPVKTVYPKGGAILPFSRVVAYYGNLYSKNMGVLGEYPEDEMLARLRVEVEKWQEADPATPVVPALHYIAVVAQRGAGDDGKYRWRMPDSEIERVLKMAEKIDAIVFLDMQAGRSNLQIELPLLEKYLKMPRVHLGIDPEYAMKSWGVPGQTIGTLDAADINFAAEYLAEIVKNNNLPPKILVVHRFTQRMVTNYKQITPLEEVQIVINMDGFGSTGAKLNTYRQFIYKEPVQFTGFKLFYKNDIIEGRGPLMLPEGILKLQPIPIYIQYQ